MKNKNLILLLAAAGVGIYLFTQMRRRRGTVTVQDAEIISEREFIEAKPSLVERAPSIIESVSKVTAALFPKKGQKKAPKKIVPQKTKFFEGFAEPKAAPAKFKVLAAAAKAAQAKDNISGTGSMDNISILY